MALTAVQLRDRLKFFRRHEHIVGKTGEVRDLMDQIEEFLTPDPRQYVLVDGMTVTVETCIEWLYQMATEDNDFDDTVRAKLGDDIYEDLCESDEWQDVHAALADVLIQRHLLDPKKREDISEDLCSHVRLDLEWDEVRGEFTRWAHQAASDSLSDSGFWLEVMARYKAEKPKSRGRLL